MPTRPDRSNADAPAANLPNRGLPLKTVRSAVVWLACYALIGATALALVARSPAKFGQVPEGHWMSTVERGDTVTWRKIEFPWGDEGIWTTLRYVGTTVTGSDYTMFRMRDSTGRRCLQLASESPQCLWVTYTRDSVIIAQGDSLRWLFRRIQP
jgi:hypothetical protein